MSKERKGISFREVLDLADSIKEEDIIDSMTPVAPHEEVRGELPLDLKKLFSVLALRAQLLRALAEEQSSELWLTSFQTDALKQAFYYEVARVYPPNEDNSLGIRQGFTVVSSIVPPNPFERLKDILGF